MQFKKSTLMIIFMILFTHSTIVPMFRFHTSYGPEYQHQFEKYMSDQQNNALHSTGFWTAIIGMSLIICNYFATGNKSEMTAQYPYAQKWYEAMNSKHPQAHLQEKYFKKDLFNESATFHDIKLLSSSLQEINAIYKKELENKELTE